VTVLKITRFDDVAYLTIDRAPVNAVDPDMIEEFVETLPGLGEDPSVRCIVIQGTGRYFVAGADLQVMRDLSAENHLRMRRWVKVQAMIEKLPKPVIAAINGVALGGGAELALACDLRIMADSATIGVPEIQLGLYPGSGGSQRLPRLLGAHQAKLLMIEGEHLTADRALNLGMVDQVVPQGEFSAVVSARAQAWAEKPTATIGLLKQVIRDGGGRDIDEALEREEDVFLKLIQTEDIAEGLQAFLEKRIARFVGR